MNVFVVEIKPFFFSFFSFLKSEEGEETAAITQHDLVNVVDVTSAQKVKWTQPPKYRLLNTAS